MVRAVCVAMNGVCARTSQSVALQVKLCELSELEYFRRDGACRV